MSNNTLMFTNWFGKVSATKSVLLNENKYVLEYLIPLMDCQCSIAQSRLGELKGDVNGEFDKALEKQIKNEMWKEMGLMREARKEKLN